MRRLLATIDADYWTAQRAQADRLRWLLRAYRAAGVVTLDGRKIDDYIDSSQLEKPWAVGAIEDLIEESLI